MFQGFGMYMSDIKVRLAEAGEWNTVIALAWRTFKQNASFNSDEEGRTNFRQSLTSTRFYMDFMLGRQIVFCACQGKKIIGILALKEMTHISLFFVKSEFQRQGIGTRLLQNCRGYCAKQGVFDLTVNAAPTGVPFYLAKGFQAFEAEQYEYGLRFTPMILKGQR